MHEKDQTSAEAIVVASADSSVRVIAFGADGRGVAACRPFEAGEVIERCPVIVVPEGDRAPVESSNVGNHIFMWEHGTTGEDLYSQTGRAAVVLGYASLLNHSSDPNCRIIRYIEALAVEVVALRRIAPDEELRFDYNMTLWFDPA